MERLVIAQTNNAEHNAVFGRNDATSAPSGAGVQGAGVFGLSHSPGAAGVFGSQNGDAGVGVQGNGPEAGVSGFSDGGAGMRAVSNQGNGVEGFAREHANAVLAINSVTPDPHRRITMAPTQLGGAPRSAEPPRGNGVLAVTTVSGAAGVFGSQNGDAGVGVQGNGPEAGVSGFSDRGAGMRAVSNRGSGSVTASDRGHGLDVFSNNDLALYAKGATFAGVFDGAIVVNNGPDPTDDAIPPSPINGSVVINDGSLFVSKGDVVLGNGQDCAEDFDVLGSDNIEPGTVMVIDKEGALKPSSRPYDKRVAGVIAGACGYKPGIVLGRQLSSNKRLPVALFGKTYCKVDARDGQIHVGDLLTTSSTPGHAMRAGDPIKAFGSVIGKALGQLGTGQGLIPILIALQ